MFVKVELAIFNLMSIVRGFERNLVEIKTLSKTLKTQKSDDIKVTSIVFDIS